MRVTKRIYNNQGERYYILPSLAVVPLIQVASFMTCTPSNIFDDPIRARNDYPTKGVKFQASFYTYTVTINVTWTAK